jgi:hypoxanthine phosphoribosyltransferase
MGTLRKLFGNESKIMKKLVIDYDQYKGLVNEICRQISTSGWTPDYIVGITRGGLWPAVMISHYFGIPCHSLQVSLRDGKDYDCESNLWMAEQAFGYVDYDLQENYGSRWDISLRHNILIVDDINDTGATLNWIVKDWQDSCLPKETSAWDSIWGHNVKFAVLVDNLSSKCKLPMNFTGLEINKAEDDVWVEFPYERWWK